VLLSGVAEEEALRYRSRMRSERHAALVALGQQIRKVRQERGVSQEEFANAAGLGRSYYGGVERGERNIAALNLMRIAAALKVEVGELFPQASVFGVLLDKATAAAAEAE
jgi:transcriptional regulator with XRE-family HTH domain